MKAARITAWTSGSTYDALDTDRTSDIGIVYAFSNDTMMAMHAACDLLDANGGGFAPSSNGTGWSDYALDESTGILSMEETPLEVVMHDGVTYYVLADVALDEAADDARCPVCGEPIDYCQGHGDIGDPVGAAVLAAHDAGEHSHCVDGACSEADPDAILSHGIVADACTACGATGDALLWTCGYRPATAPRTYVIGIPAVVTVHADGTVTIEACTEEAGAAIRDEGHEDDAAIVDAAHDAGSIEYV